MEIINKIRTLVIEKYSESFDLVIIFGSLVKGKFNQFSDIDLAVKILNNKDALNIIPMFIVDVAENLGIVEDKIDVLLLNDEIPIELEFDVFSNGILIYARDKELYINMITKVFSKYADYIIFIKKLNLRKAYVEALWRNVYGKTK